MRTTGAKEFRARATQARRIADSMHDRGAQSELRDMASALDAEAERLEGGETPNLMPVPVNDV